MTDISNMNSYISDVLDTIYIYMYISNWDISNIHLLFISNGDMLIPPSHGPFLSEDLRCHQVRPGMILYHFTKKNEDPAVIWLHLIWVNSN